jgi:hypothetical protein
MTIKENVKMKIKVKFIKEGQQLTGIFPNFTDYQIWRLEQVGVRVLGMEQIKQREVRK